MKDINDRIIRTINMAFSIKGEYPTEIHLGEKEFSELVEFIKYNWTKQPKDFNNLQFAGCKVVKANSKNYLLAKIIYKKN